jgi:hypothetical protein
VVAARVGEDVPMSTTERRRGLTSGTTPNCSCLGDYQTTERFRDPAFVEYHQTFFGKYSFKL